MFMFSRHVLLVTACVAGLSLGAMTGRAEGDPAQDLVALEAQLAAAKEAQAELVRRMVEAIRAQEDASAKLVELAGKARNQEEALAKTQGRLDKLQTDNAKALLALAKKRDSLSKLLAGLQRLEQNPPPALVVSPGDVSHGFARRHDVWRGDSGSPPRHG